MNKYKKKTIVGLALSMAILIFGLIACFTFHHSCGASNHGGMMAYVCTEPFMRLPTSIVIIAIGGFLTILFTILLVRHFAQKKSINTKETDAANI